MRMSVRVLMCMPVIHSVFPVDPKDMQSLSSFFLPLTTAGQAFL